MRRMILFAMATAVFVGSCQTSDDTEDRLRTQLDEARARIATLEDDVAALQKPAPEKRRQSIDKERYADLWGGGPTIGGPLVALPRLGILRWRCDDDKRFRFVFRPAGASVTVAYVTGGGARRSTTLQPGNAVTTPWVEMGQDVRWTVTYRHKPGFVRGDITVKPQLSPKRGSCLATVSSMEINGHHWE